MAPSQARVAAVIGDRRPQGCGSGVGLPDRVTARAGGSMAKISLRLQLISTPIHRRGIREEIASSSQLQRGIAAASQFGQS